MAREVEKDWERAGDYLRAGLDGREYFQCPRPRWESLHDLQGLVELWRVTARRSIARPSFIIGAAFAAGTAATPARSVRASKRTGNPYAPTAIETLLHGRVDGAHADYLRLTGDPRAADDLELAHAQRRSGRRSMSAAVGGLTIRPWTAFAKPALTRLCFRPALARRN